MLLYQIYLFSIRGESICLQFFDVQFGKSQLRAHNLSAHHCLQCDVSVSQTTSGCDLSDSAQCLAYPTIYFLYDLHTYNFTEISVVYLQALIIPLCFSLFVPLLFLRWLNGPKRKRKNSQCSVKSMTGECLMDAALTLWSGT